LTEDNKSERLKRETYYILLLGTVFPRGLNQFPIEERKKYEKLNITTQSDLVNFFNSLPEDSRVGALPEDNRAGALP